MNLTSSKRKLFVAYPWDMYIKSMYDEILTNLSETWDIRHGADVTKIDKADAEIEMFRSRNKQLYDIFVSGIEKSEVFIADVTKANANVMLELGIAIQLNKNILIVTSQNPTDLPFDIKGFKVNQYKSKQELDKIIKQQLNLFLKIKNQNFDSYFNESYFKSEKGELQHRSPLKIQLPEKIKNLKLRVEYRFVSVSRDDDWFGIHLRAQVSMPIITISELLYVRKNTHLESVTWGRRTPVDGKEKRIKTTALGDGYHLLEMVLEENKLIAYTSAKELVDDLIQVETFGEIILQVNAHDGSKVDDLKVEFRNLEIINLDTISPTS